MIWASKRFVLENTSLNDDYLGWIVAGDYCGSSGIVSKYHDYDTMLTSNILTILEPSLNFISINMDGDIVLRGGTPARISGNSNGYGISLENAQLLLVDYGAAPIDLWAQVDAAGGAGVEFTDLPELLYSQNIEYQSGNLNSYTLLGLSVGELKVKLEILEK